MYNVPIEPVNASGSCSGNAVEHSYHLPLVKDPEDPEMTVRSRSSRSQAAQQTMKRFLEAAEDVFGRYGYEGTTIRAIAAKASVNLGTLKHYWGSKRELFRDLLQRRLRPIHDESNARLAAVEAAATRTAKLDPGQVLACLIEPAFLVGVKSANDDYNDPEVRSRFHLFFGRVLMDPSPEVVAESNDLFEDTTSHFLRLLRRACPELSTAELDWRVNCVFGAVGFAQVYTERIGRFVGSEADVDDALAARWVMHFLTQGIGADALVPVNELNQVIAERSAAKQRHKRRPTVRKRG